jgi:hypothetical protein
LSSFGGGAGAIATGAGGLVEQPASRAAAPAAIIHLFIESAQRPKVNCCFIEQPKVGRPSILW